MTTKTVRIDTMDKRNSIRIGLIGCISSGKSTLLNAICVNQYEDMKTKRTTMLPTLYQETNTYISKNKAETKLIYKQNKEMNKMISTKDFKLTNENCTVVENIIPKINDFTNLPRNVFTDLYDIPGLNDFQTRDIYFQWIENNFQKFDIIFHVIDIENPLNTSDQLDILKLICRNIKKEKEKNNRDVFLLTIINKCDEMELDVSGNFIHDEENADNYRQIVQHTTEVILEIIGKDMNPSMFAFTPISAADTFIYRMLHNDPNVELDMKLLQKFGVNEVGKRNWNKMNDSERKKMIADHFKKVNINDTLQLTGYNELTEIVNKYLNSSRTQSILINRLKKEINNEKNINREINKDNDNITDLCNLYNSNSSKIWSIDKLFKTNNSIIVSDLIKYHIVKWIHSINLGNQNLEDLNTLEEYKKIYKKFYNTLDTYFLNNKVQLVIDKSKETLWKAFYKTESLTDKPLVSSISSIILAIIKGISDKQNEYYINKLKDNSTYNDFPKNIYHNIDCLIQNKYKRTEDIISDVLNFILRIIFTQDIITSVSKKDIFQKTYNSSITSSPEDKHNIFDSYVFSKFIDPDKKGNINPNQITIIGFCEYLIFNYDYPVKLIRDFLYKYIIGYYHLITDSGIRNILQQNTYNKAYTILMDNWLNVIIHHQYTTQEYMSMKQGYLTQMKNLYYINKSYIHLSDNLQLFTGTHYTLIDYSYFESTILALPKYYHFISNTSFKEHQKSYANYMKKGESLEDDTEYYDVIE